MVASIYIHCPQDLLNERLMGVDIKDVNELHDILVLAMLEGLCLYDTLLGG